MLQYQNYNIKFPNVKTEPWTESTETQGTGGSAKGKIKSWAQTLREGFKFSIKENTQVETEDKIRESQPRVVRKQTLVYLVSIQQRPPDNDHPHGYQEFE